MTEANAVLVLCGSPRRNGNSRRLAEAAARGARAAGSLVTLEHVDDHVQHFLRDCRQCRDRAGRCSIDDGFETLLHRQVLPARGVIFATPLYWYGMSGQLKTFFDRLFCYIAASSPDADEVVAGLMRKRLGLLISSEETYPTSAAGIVHQLQEYARYTHSQLVGVVQGVGNRRGDVEHDPADPLARAEALGRHLLDGHYADYRIDTPRPGSVWGNGTGAPRDAPAEPPAIKSR